MTKEQFTSLGLAEDLAAKAAAESEKELKDYIPKHRFDEVSTENKTLKDTVKKSEADLEELKKTAGDSAGLTEQIQKLQDAAKEEAQKHQGELKEVKMMNAIKLAIAGKAQDEELVAGLFDKTKLILGDDGSVTGLDEQLKTLQEGKKFLFKEEQKAETKPGFHKIGGDPPAGGQVSEHAGLKGAIAAHYQTEK